MNDAYQGKALIGKGSKRGRILFVGDGGSGTGYSRIIKIIGDALKSNFDILQLATNYSGDPVGWEWDLYRADLHGDAMGFGRISELVDVHNPAVIIFVCDTWAIENYLKRLGGTEWRGSTVAYSSGEGGPLDQDFLDNTSRLSVFVSCTKSIATIAEEGYRTTRRQTRPDSTPRVYSMGHPVDASVFFPLGQELTEANCAIRDQARARELVFGSRDRFAEDFILLNANRNQPRKKIDVTLEAFAQFATGKPKSVKLCLHMGLRSLGWDIMRAARYFGIENRLILTSKSDHGVKRSDQFLNLLYNACDVGVNTSCSEGWGLIAIEQAATGMPSVLGAHSAHLEQWTNGTNAILVEPSLRMIQPSSVYFGWHCSVEGFAEAFESLYTQPQLVRMLGNQAWRLVQGETFSIVRFSRFWQQLIDPLVQETVGRIE